jgi:hypothetical protein
MIRWSSVFGFLIVYGEVFHAAASAAIAALFQIGWKLGPPFPPISAWIGDDEHWVDS